MPHQLASTNVSFLQTKISISKNILFAQTVPSSIEGVQLCGKKTL